MKFLINIEDKINQLLSVLWDKLLQSKLVTTTSIKFKNLLYAIKLFLINSLSFLKHKKNQFFNRFTALNNLLTRTRGHFVGFLIYLRSEEFKKGNKKELIVNLIKNHILTCIYFAKSQIKFNPIKNLTVLGAFIFLITTTTIIAKKSMTIFTGINKIRHPSSVEIKSLGPFIMENLDFVVGNDQKINLDIKIFSHTQNELNEIKKQKEKIARIIKNQNLNSFSLPLSLENMTKIENIFKKSLSDFKYKDLKIVQKLKERPNYFKQAERMLHFENIHLQLFLENVRRNRQVLLEFTLVASNRNVILFLKQHETEFKDHLNSYVEPIIPQLPIDDEGRRIIKDKIKLEINDFLKKYQIEGKSEEIYIDYIIVS